MLVKRNDGKVFGTLSVSAFFCLAIKIGTPHFEQNAKIKSTYARNSSLLFLKMQATYTKEFYTLE